MLFASDIEYCSYHKQTDYVMKANSENGNNENDSFIEKKLNKFHWKKAIKERAKIFQTKIKEDNGKRFLLGFSCDTIGAEGNHIEIGLIR